MKTMWDGFISPHVGKSEVCEKTWMQPPLLPILLDPPRHSPSLFLPIHLLPPAYMFRNYGILKLTCKTGNQHSYNDEELSHNLHSAVMDRGIIIYIRGPVNNHGYMDTKMICILYGFHVIWIFLTTSLWIPPESFTRLGFGDEWWEIHLNGKPYKMFFSHTFYSNLIMQNTLRKVEDHATHCEKDLSHSNKGYKTTSYMYWSFSSVQLSCVILSQYPISEDGHRYMYSGYLLLMILIESQIS